MTLSPTSKFCAPHTTPCTPDGSIPLPSSCCEAPSGTTWTCVQLMVLPLECSSGVFSNTFPTTMGPVRSNPWTSSSSRPTMTRSAIRSSAVASAGSCVYSRNQDNGIRMLGLYLHSKRKTRVYIRVNACSAQYLRVYHTAATPFDPLWAAFGIRVPDVKFSRRFREREEVGTQPNGCVGTKHGGREVFQRAS